VSVENLTHGAAVEWLSQGRRVVEAILVDVAGSAPLDLGATMLIDEDIHIEGSVTGGCVEGALVQESARVLETGTPRLLTFGISDEVAGDVGLMCGGTVRIFLSELVDEHAAGLAAGLAATHAGHSAATATLLDGPAAGHKLVLVDDEAIGGLGVTELLDRSVARDASGLLEQGVSMIRHYRADGATMGDDLPVFIHARARTPRMVIFGAIDFSAAVAPLAAELGYAVTICDARRPFLESRRFSRSAEVVSDWPDRYLAGQTLGERDVVLVFTHDSKFDEPALIAALATDVGYIGALGSRRTQQDRRARLLEAGVSAAELERITGPCGLDIGAATPMETAVSIMAEVIARRSERPGISLTDTSRPIHSRRGAPVL
jgi:xanthine dehydrogenase accessory factor